MVMPFLGRGMAMSNSKLDTNIFKNLSNLSEKLEKIEKRIDQLELKMEKVLSIQSCHIMRVKNGEQLSDDYILNQRAYHDLTPEKAFHIYQNQNADFILLDVSAKEFYPEIDLPESIKIPLEELKIRHIELPSKITSLMIISENGTRSINACELLNELGYFNINNISGGYKFWPGHKVKDNSKKIA